MTTAFVFTGTGSLAAQHVGMARALADRGINPDLLIGTSAGAANAAFLAGYGAGPGALGRLARLWAGLGRRDLFPAVRGWPSHARVRVTAPRSSPVPLRRLLGSQLPYVRLEDARIPVHLLACDALTGTKVLLSDGLAVTAVMACCAMPGVFPAVERRGRTLVDGTFAAHSATAVAAEFGVERIFVLPDGKTERRLGPGHPGLYFLPAPSPLGIGAADFRHAPTLIRAARDSTSGWLDAVGLPAASDRVPAPALRVPEQAGRTLAQTS